MSVIGPRSYETVRGQLGTVPHREPQRGSRRQTGSLQYSIRQIPIFHAGFTDLSRYDGAALRKIRKGGQARECARRLAKQGA